MNTAYTTGFDDPACRDASEFGGKAAGLAVMTAAGLPVAPGFAISAGAYRAFLRSSGPLQRASAPVPDPVARAIRDRYQRLCAETGAAAVAVRSSATAEDCAAASFAGRFGTWVDITGAADVIGHVRRCWGTLLDARAVGYARVNGMDPAAIEMAVVVQRMVRARVSGVMFTISPVTGDRSRIVIEASWGLGLAVVGGEVTPDRWIVDKVNLALVDYTPGDKRIEYRRGHSAVPVEPGRRTRPCLTGDQVIALARLGKETERLQRAPQDIEFAFAADEPVLLQLRPETVWSARPRVPRFDARHGVTRWISGAVSGAGE